MKQTTEDVKRELREAVKELIDAINQSLHLYDLIDWLNERLKK